MKIRINEWRYAPKKGLKRAKAAITGAPRIHDDCIFRNFLFQRKDKLSVRKLLVSEFGPKNVKSLPQTEKKGDDCVYLEQYFMDSNGLEIFITANTEDEPPWGYISISGITKSNNETALRLSKLLDDVLEDHPIECREAPFFLAHRL
jgi:hypothetical protein